MLRSKNHGDWLVTKYLTTAFVVVLVSEIAKRSDKLGALVAALPLVTILALIWLQIESFQPRLVHILVCDPYPPDVSGFSVVTAAPRILGRFSGQRTHYSYLFLALRPVCQTVWN